LSKPDNQCRLDVFLPALYQANFDCVSLRNSNDFGIERLAAAGKNSNEKE
jgi:hypothetical protein